MSLLHLRDPDPGNEEPRAKHDKQEHGSAEPESAAAWQMHVPDSTAWRIVQRLSASGHRGCCRSRQGAHEVFGPGVAFFRSSVHITWTASVCRTEARSGTKQNVRAGPRQVR